jgi:hypothetical protein
VRAANPNSATVSRFHLRALANDSSVSQATMATSLVVSITGVAGYFPGRSCYGNE